MYLNRPAAIPREEYLAEANKCKALNNQLIGQGSKKVTTQSYLSYYNLLEANQLLLSSELYIK